MPNSLKTSENHGVKANIFKGTKSNILLFLYLSDGLSLIDKTSAGKGRLRNLLPEPFDWFNHAGNFSVSTNTALASTYISALALSKTTEQSPSTVRRAAVAVGVTAVAVINSLAETRWGLNITGSSATPDYVDLAYGVGAGAFATSLITVEHSEQVIPIPATITS